MNIANKPTGQMGPSEKKGTKTIANTKVSNAGPCRETKERNSRLKNLLIILIIII